MFQDHGLNANGKLLRRFYEPLILLSVLDPTRGAHRPDLITDRGLQGREKLWRNFLDQLSFLCDAKKGGDTVTAIAAQRTVDHTVLWLASNSNARNRAKHHVEWILSQLKRLYDADLEEIERVENELTARCVEFSSSRIRTYLGFLLSDIKRSRTPNLTAGSEDEQLFEALQPFERHRNNPHALCAYAYEFRDTEAVRILTRRHTRHEARGQWSDIRHNIGRLGCWIKAVKTLLQAARAFPQHLEGAAVDLVMPRGLADIPPAKNSRLGLDFRSVVNRMVPKDQQAITDTLVQSLDELNMVSPVKVQFQEAYSTFQPRPHAELLVLEHFFERDFEFVHDDRYIGCSKPSCYCCGLYMKVHPGRFEQRACHGNLWPNWGPPIPLPVVTSPGKASAQVRRPQEHHTFKLLQDMATHVRGDVHDQIQSRRPRRSRVPDSSTGMSSVIVDSSLIRTVCSRASEASNNFNPKIASLIVAEVENRPEDAELASVHSDMAAIGTYINTGAEDDSGEVAFPIEAGMSSMTMKEEGMRMHLSTIVEDPSSEDEDGEVLVFRGRRR